MVTSDLFLPQNFSFPYYTISGFRPNNLFLNCFPPSSSHSLFQDSWRPHDVSQLRSACRSLSSTLSFHFPSLCFPNLPTFIHPLSLLSFLCSLVSKFNGISGFPSVPLSQTPETQYIASSLRKLVLVLQAHSFSPIVSLSLPPCLSVNIFVSQVSFLAHLISSSLPATSAGNVHANSATLATGESATSEAQALHQVSAGLATPAADVRRAPGVAWASVWVRRRPAQGVAAKQGAAVVPLVVAAVQGVSLPVVAEADASAVAYADADADANADADAEADATAEADADAEAEAEAACSVPVCAGGGTVCVAPVFAGGESVCSVPPSCKGRDAACSVPVGNGSDTVCVVPVCAGPWAG